MKKVLSLVCVLLLCAALIPAAVAEEAAYTETVVSIPNGDHDIPATVCVPNGEGKFPAVVMLHGTGSNRDEAGNGYKMAAPVLAEKYGIATVRIDFMGSGDSTADYTGYTFESAAAAYMQALENIDADKIGVMGWSQGGTDALLAAARHPELFKSLVTWAGAPDLSDMLPDELYEEAKKNGFFVMTFDWRDSLNVSVLAIHGKEDTTVDPEWSNKIVAASKNEASKTYFIEGMDHTFNVFSEEDFHSLYNAVDATGEFFKATLAD